jgi:hydroxyacylglutathione hydrolase
VEQPADQTDHQAMPNHSTDQDQTQRIRPMILKQYYLGCLAHASYLVADQAGGRAAVIDPQRDIEQYLADAEQLGCTIGHVFLTHMHADFIAGHLELRDRAGATIHLGARASAEYAYTAMADGDEVRLGRTRLSVLETPGHSPESISILVFDLEHGQDRPYAVLTGDTLFIGDVGRPDLRASLGWSPERLAGMLYDSLHDKLLPLPDDTLVYPAHGAGSLCGKNLSTDTVSTIGEQRKYNYALQPMSRQRFIQVVTADQPDTPAYFTYDAVLNARERPTLDEALERELRPLSLAKLLELVADGAQLLDTREQAEFEGAHIHGALNVGLGGSFATWCGTILDQGRSVVLIAEPGRETEAATRLARIGFDTVAGYLSGGMQQLDDAGELVERTDRITAGALAEELRASAPPVLIDVRTTREWSDAHIDGAVNLPLAQLAERTGELPLDRAMVVCCASGYRSAIATSLLRREGRQHVANLVGGLGAWTAARLATVAANA